MVENRKSVVCLSLNPELLGRIDEKRGAVPRSRFVEMLLRQALERPEFIEQARNPITRPISFSAEMLMELLRMQQEESNP